MKDLNLESGSIKVMSEGGDDAASARDSRVKMEQSLEFWRKRLAGIPAVLELPTDRPRPPAQSFRIAQKSVLFSQHLAAQLEALSEREGVALPVVLLAAFHTLLTRYTRQDDIVVGALLPAGGHDFEGAPEFPLPIRTDLSGELSFSQLLGVVNEAVSTAHEHQNVSWARLVEAVQPDQDASRHAVYQAAFSFQDSCASADSESIDSELKVDLHLRLRCRPQGLAADFAYTTDLFDAPTISRMTGHLEKLLEGIAANPQENILRLPLLTDEERHTLVVGWNDMHMDFARDRSVHQLFEAQAAKTPNATAVAFGKDQLTYGDLDRRANQLAHHLIDLGAQPDGLVGICVERSIDMIVGLLGILKAGSAYVPIDPAYPRDRVAFMIEDSEAPLLLTQSQLAGNLPRGSAKLVLIDSDWPEISQQSQARPALTLDPENRAYVIFTSGSTGKPKGVEITHRAVVNFLTTMAERPGLHAGDYLLAVTTLSFDIAGLEIYLPLTQGATVEIVSRETAADGPQLLAQLNASGATVMQATPATWRMLLEAGWTGDKQLKILIGGEAVSQKLAGQLLEKSGSVWNVYGPTETTIWSTTSKLEIGQGAVTIGRPIGNTEIFILDKLLQLAPIGVAGELLIGGEGLARGYLKRPELTVEKFITHPLSGYPQKRLYRTGDLVRYLPNGNIEFLGRIDHQVKIRGFRIELGEIEAVLRQHPAIGETVVVAREDVPGDKRVVAYFVPARGASPTTAELRSFLKEKLPEYMLPSVFAPLETMPLTPNGKVDRRALPAPEQLNLAPSAEEFVAPRDEAETKLVKIWEDLLGVRPIGVRHDFFELGGHSLLAARMMTQIKKQFATNVPIATLFQARSVEQLARTIRDRGWKPVWSSVVPIQTTGTKPPFFCVHGIGGNVLGFYELSTHLGRTQPFYGLQAQGLDGTTPPHTNAEEMAAQYVKEMRAVQPHGPYYLGGLSFGGAIAFEMARQLQEQGEEVGVLALFDTFVGSRKSKASLLKKLWTLPAARRNAYVALKWKMFIQNAERWILPPTLQKVRAAHRLAHRRHIMRRYDGRVTLFVPSDPSLRASEDPRADWKRYANDLEILEVPGDHLTLLDEPHVGVLAQRLAECLAEAQTKSANSGNAASVAADALAAD